MGVLLLAAALNPVYTVIFVVLLLLLLVAEIWGVRSKGKGDTLTEHWRWLEAWLSGGWAWVFRVATGGLLIWALLHFLVGAE